MCLLVIAIISSRLHSKIMGCVHYAKEKKLHFLTPKIGSAFIMLVDTAGVWRWEIRSSLCMCHVEYVIITKRW